MAKEPTYTPKEDVAERYKDGSSTVVVAKDGKAIPWSSVRVLTSGERAALYNGGKGRGMLKEEPPMAKEPT